MPAREHGFLAQACFFASQAAEKALKSALIELGVDPPHTPVLLDLVRSMQATGLDVGSLLVLPLQRLSRMAISSRYPMDNTPPSEVFDAEETDQALYTAATVIYILEGMDGSCASWASRRWLRCWSWL